MQNLVWKLLKVAATAITLYSRHLRFIKEKKTLIKLLLRQTPLVCRLKKIVRLLKPFTFIKGEIMALREKILIIASIKSIIIKDFTSTQRCTLWTHSLFTVLTFGPLADITICLFCWGFVCAEPVWIESTDPGCSVTRRLLNASEAAARH